MDQTVSNPMSDETRMLQELVAKFVDHDLMPRWAGLRPRDPP